jgi:hypothetical protein
MVLLIRRRERHLDGCAFSYEREQQGRGPIGQSVALSERLRFRPGQIRRIGGRWALMSRYLIEIVRSPHACLRSQTAG